MLRLVSITIICLLASACAAVPVPLKVASWAVDGISYLVTQKSVMDHGLSAMNGQDCAVVRLATEGSACRDEPSTAIAFQGAPFTPTVQAPAVSLTSPTLTSPTLASPTFTPTTLACDAPRISSGMPSDRALYRCAELLIYKDGHAGALDQSERRIAFYSDAQDTGGALVWRGVRLAVIDLANVAQLPTDRPNL